MKKLFLALILCVFLMGMSWLPPPPEELPHAPILMIHGLYGLPASWNRLLNWLEDEGFDPDLMYAPQVEDNFSMCSVEHIKQIEDTIALIRSETGAETVTLIGHSRGGTGIMGFMRTSNNRDSVGNVITLAGANNYACDMVYGTFLKNDTPGNALYTSIYTVPTDGVISERVARLEGARNVEYTDLSHHDFILDERVFEDVLEALNGGGLNY